MARLVNGINGPIKGKVGTVVGSSCKGVDYIKAHNPARTKNISDKEQANRNKFGTAHEWLQPLLKFVRQGFKGYAPTYEGFLAAKSYLLKNAVENSIINPALVKVSFGDLPLSGNMAAELLPNSEVRFTWDTAHVNDTRGTDQVMILAYNIERRYAAYHIYGSLRYTGVDTLRLYPGTGTWHLYMAFVADDRSRQSYSVYMGEIEL